MASGTPASGEDSLIARYFRPLATDPGAFRLDDDAAALKPYGDDIVVTTDAIVEGVHFLPDDPPDTIARKALRVNLSDLAAKGATPAGFVLTLALRSADDAWLKPFAAALGEDAAQFGCPLLGGDTVSTPGPLMISITAFGRVPPGRMVHRSGAKARRTRHGDRHDRRCRAGACHSQGRKGSCRGNAMHAAREMLVGRYRVPQPRVALAEIVRDHASAAMDVSDGLAGDLAKLCGVSGVSAVIDLARSRCPSRGPRSGVARRCRARDADRRRRRLRDPVHGPGGSRRCVRAGCASRGCTGQFHRRTIVAGNAAPTVHGRGGQGTRAGTAVLQPFLTARRSRRAVYIRRITG